MGLASGRDTAASQTDKPGSIPWWAQEMGMTEEEYWSGLHGNSSMVASESDTTPGTLCKVEMSQVWLDPFNPPVENPLLQYWSAKRISL